MLVRSKVEFSNRTVEDEYVLAPLPQEVVEPYALRPKRLEADPDLRCRSSRGGAVKTVEAYAQLRQLDRPIFTTREAAALWRIEQTSASRRLGRLGTAGLVLRIQRGLWALDPAIEPRIVGPFLTNPFPSYVSLF